MRPLIFILLLLLFGCGNKPDNLMKCSNDSSGYRKCTVDVIRQIMHVCKANNMKTKHMVYQNDNSTASFECDPFTTLDGKNYWNMINERTFDAEK